MSSADSADAADAADSADAADAADSADAADAADASEDALDVSITITIWTITLASDGNKHCWAFYMYMREKLAVTNYSVEGVVNSCFVLRQLLW